MCVPDLLAFFDQASCAVISRHVLRCEQNGVGAHTIVASTSTGGVWAPHTCLVMLGTDDVYDYAGHFVLDIGDDIVRVVAAWAQTHTRPTQARLDTQRDPYAPLASVVWDLFATPLRLQCALGHATLCPPRPTRIPPIVQAGSMTCVSELEFAVALSRKRVWGACTIQRAWRWYAHKRVECLGDTAERLIKQLGLHDCSEMDLD